MPETDISKIGVNGDFHARMQEIGHAIVEYAGIPNSSKEIIQLLRKPNAPPSLNDIEYQGDTPIMSAIRSGAINNIPTLAEYGADLNGENRDSITPPPLFLGLRTASAIEVVKIFKELGADMNVKDNGQSAYFYAKNNPEKIIALARAGVKPDPNLKGETPLDRLERSSSTWPMNSIAAYAAAGFQLPSTLENYTHDPEKISEFTKLKEEYSREIKAGQPNLNATPSAPTPIVATPKSR